MYFKKICTFVTSARWLIKIVTKKLQVMLTLIYHSLIWPYRGNLFPVQYIQISICQWLILKVTKNWQNICFFQFVSSSSSWSWVSSPLFFISIRNRGKRKQGKLNILPEFLFQLCSSSLTWHIGPTSSANIWLNIKVLRNSVITNSVISNTLLLYRTLDYNEQIICLKWPFATSINPVIVNPGYKQEILPVLSYSL